MCSITTRKPRHQTTTSSAHLEYYNGNTSLLTVGHNDAVGFQAVGRLTTATMVIWKGAVGGIPGPRFQATDSSGMRSDRPRGGTNRATGSWHPCRTSQHSKVRNPTICASQLSGAGLPCFDQCWNSLLIKTMSVGVPAGSRIGRRYHQHHVLPFLNRLLCELQSLRTQELHHH